MGRITKRCVPLALAAGSLALGLGCASRSRLPTPAASPPRAPTRVVVTLPTARPEQPPEDPPALGRDEALQSARALLKELSDHEQKVDEAWVLALLRAIAGPCLREPDDNGPACHEIAEREGDVARTVIMLTVLLGEAADPVIANDEPVRLLLRLGARGVYDAGEALDHLLTRRMQLALGTSTARCEPPSVAEVAAARAKLDDFATVVPAPGPSRPPAAPSSLVARWPTRAELDDLAYFYAAVADAGPEVGAAQEDQHAKPLPAGHPDLALRQRLREQMNAALGDGDSAAHLRAAEAYLASLGYPGPLRLAEEDDMRWGGAGASYMMRAAARSAELLGRYDVAEALYRRALPGGGMCGTTVDLRLADQIAGAIRAAEQGRGCRGAVADRLFAITTSADSPSGLGRLERAGFDVVRLYRGAILTSGRDDAREIERALRQLRTRSGEALARLQKSGVEAWATRVRAIGGYADTAKAAAIPWLLALAEAGANGARVDALWTLGELLHDHGHDPCSPSESLFGGGGGSSDGRRSVRTVMDACATRPRPPVLEGAVHRVEALAKDPDPAVRQAVAETLGRMGAARSRRVVQALARDTFDIGGRVCTQTGSGPEVCGPNRPVAEAAKEALEEIDAAAAVRAQQHARGKAR